MPRGKQPRLADADFIEIFRSQGARGIVERSGVGEREAYDRRVRLERKYNIKIEAPGINEGSLSQRPERYPGRLDYRITDGLIVIGSDPHYWPGIVSTSHRALVKFCEREKPKCVIMNGDVFDGATISRHPPINWEERPSVTQELEACKDRLGEIIKAALGADFYWPLGNHDARFESRLAQVAPEYANVHGMHLADHFPDWQKCWSVDVNNTLWVSHRYKGGVNAAYNNTLHAGRSTATGHLHQGTAFPKTDLNGTRWGISLPILANPFGPQFEYQEDNPRDHREGFTVLAFVDGKMLAPQMALVIDETHIDYCNQLIEV